MKQKQLQIKLNLNKTTISKLNDVEKLIIKGGNYTVVTCILTEQEICYQSIAIGACENSYGCTTYNTMKNVCHGKTYQIECLI